MRNINEAGGHELARAGARAVPRQPVGHLAGRRGAARQGKGWKATTAAGRGGATGGGDGGPGGAARGRHRHCPAIPPRRVRDAGAQVAADGGCGRLGAEVPRRRQGGRNAA
eukprot:931077-Pleurochrysis_carterae.AAC.1